MAFDSDPSAPRPLINPNFPRVVLGLACAIVGVSLIQFIASPRLENWMYEAAALVGGTDIPAFERHWGPFAPYVLHTFLHGGALHLILNMVALLMFGPAVAKAFGGNAVGAVWFLIFFCVCAIGGGIAQMYIFSFQSELGVAIGASSAISGLLPALGWLRGGMSMAIRTSLPWLVAGFTFPILLRLAGRA